MAARYSPISSPSTPSRGKAVWPTFAILLACLGTVTSNTADPDLWGHYQYGKEVLRDGEMPTVTTWSYAVEGWRWINHENLAEIATAWAADTFGVLGLTLGKLLLAAVIFGSAIWSTRRLGAGWLAIGLIGVLAADNIRFHWHFRPHAWSYAYFAIMLAVLGEAFRGWQGDWRGWKASLSGSPVEPPPNQKGKLRRLWFLPPLLCLWTNTHGGFAAGLAIYCAVLGLRMLQAWAWWGRASQGLQKRLAMMIVAGILATLINPYGPELHLWMLDTLGAAPPEIGDWAPLELFFLQAQGFWMLIAVATYALLQTRQRRDAVQLVLMGLILWQGLSHCRHICFFAIMCAFWIPPHLDSAFETIRQSWRAQLAGRIPSPWIGRGLRTAFVAWLAVVAAHLGSRLSTIPVERGQYPVAAMQFLRDHDLRGRTMVTFNWAQYAIACFASDPVAEPSKVAIDGRLNTCYPREVLDIYLDFLLGAPTPESRLRSPGSGPYDPTLALTYQSPDLFVLDRRQQPAVQVISASPGWSLLYQDGLAQIWGRSDRYDDPRNPGYFPPELRPISDKAPRGSTLWPALPESRRKVAVAAQ